MNGFFSRIRRLEHQPRRGAPIRLLVVMAPAGAPRRDDEALPLDAALDAGSAPARQTEGRGAAHAEAELRRLERLLDRRGDPLLRTVTVAIRTDDHVELIVTRPLSGYRPRCWCGKNHTEDDDKEGTPRPLAFPHRGPLSDEEEEDR
jgi:hypothetical protein